MASKRDQLLDTALELFYRDGFHATGIDRIVAEAGVARMTLYKHFGSKDELILAALRRRDEDFRRWVVRELERRADSPRGRLLALFELLGEWFGGGGPGAAPFLGCAFLKAASEYADLAAPVHRLAAEHKRLLRDHLAGLCAAAGAGDAGALADELMILVEGAAAVAQVSGDKAAAARAKAMAGELLDRRLGAAGA